MAMVWSSCGGSADGMGAGSSGQITQFAEMGHNTSAAAGFPNLPNGTGGANVSKVPTSSLLYPGATTKIYAHFMAWFGNGGHANVGYTSNNPSQVAKQVDDMISRGIAGVIIDWYGAGGRMEDSTTKEIMRAAEIRNSKFTFALTYDGGAMIECAKGGCDLNQQAINDLNYGARTYFGSPAYMKMKGRPVVFFFDPDRFGMLDWARIKANVQGNPLFIFRDPDGFRHPSTDGSYSWVGINGNPDDWGQAYHSYFYGMANAMRNLIGIGSVKPGFDDRVAAWREGRRVNFHCGQTWLNTFAEIGRSYSSANQMDALQIVTWNDYEEGSAIEPGVDNCLSISGSLSGTQLRWEIRGAENTLNHFSILAGNGENVKLLADVPVNTRSLDIAKFDLKPGEMVYVKAVGKPSIVNHVTQGIKVGQ